MRMVNYAQQLTDVIISHKKVGKTPSDLSERVEDFLKQVDELNAQRRDRKRYGEDLISDILILSIFKPFIMPNSVTISGAEEDQDFFIREDENENLEKWDAEDFDSFASVIAGILKIDEKVPVSQCRNDVIITSETKSNLATSDGRASAKSTTGIIPIPVTVNVLKDDRYFEDLDKVIRRVIEHIAD